MWNNINKHKKLVTFFLFSFVAFNSTAMLLSIGSSSSNSPDLINQPIEIEDVISSDVFYPESVYNLTSWWDTTWRFRIAIEVENTENIDEYEPIEVYLQFRDDEYFTGTERIIKYDPAGPPYWSDPIPVQVWNVTPCVDPDYIQSCSITFLADVPAQSNVTYFFYYNENDDGIDTSYDYDTDFSSTIPDGETLTVNVRGDSGSDYKIVLQEGYAARTLEKDGINYHSPNSLSPEKQLSHPNLRFLAHMDEGQGTTVIDSSGYEGLGVFKGTSGGSPEWTTGIINSAVDFEYADPGFEWVSWAGGLDDPGEPFSGSSQQWTMMCWIKPETLQPTDTLYDTNHLTMNCFMAKAHDSINDNFEIGVNPNAGLGTNPVHIYLDTEQRDGQVDIPCDVQEGEWNFIALVVDFTQTAICVSLRVNDQWFYSTYWDGSGTGTNDMDEAVGSFFTIGGSEHTDQNFDGVIDEVALYNTSLSQSDIETYKYSTNPSVIDEITTLESGQVFSKYAVDWTAAFDMHVTDICTFYHDLNVWNINRSIYFDDEYEGESSASKMNAMNTYFNFSQIDDHDECYLIYDGVTQLDITDTSGLTAEDYTVVYNEPDASSDAIGLFITNYALSNPSQSNISYFNGSISYYDKTIRFTPGSNSDFDNSIGGDSYKLIIDFWEYCDSVVFTNETALSWYFNNISAALKHELNAYVYEQESKFYRINVYVEDHDGRPVPDATITLYNMSDTSITWSQETDSTGRTSFERFSNGSFIINASYTEYGETLSITTPKDIVNLGSLVSTQGIHEVNFIDVALTSIVLNCSRYYEYQYKSPLYGAKLNFTFFDDGDSVGHVLNGYISTNDTGAAIFRWANTTAGNVSISIQWFDRWQEDIASALDNSPPAEKTYINLDFTDYAWHEVNVTEGRDFNTYLDLFDINNNPLIEVECQLGESFTINANYSYSENGTLIGGLEDATVSVNIKKGNKVLNTNPLQLTQVGEGYYTITINTSELISGSTAWLSSITYTLDFAATKPGYEEATNGTSVTLADLTARLTVNESISYANWFEELRFRVYYEFNNSGTWTGIENASVSFYEEDYSDIAEEFDDLGNGWYELSINTSTYFYPGTGEYDLYITAELQNYQTIILKHDIEILEIRTQINSTEEIFDPDDINLYFGESLILYFNYTQAITGTGLEDAEIARFDWSKRVEGVKVAGGEDVDLNDIGGGIYSLDFNTANLEVAHYKFEIEIHLSNYELRRSIINLYIIRRAIHTAGSTNYAVVSGNTLRISICLTDELNGANITDITEGDIYVVYKGQTFNLTHTEGGCYTTVISNIPSDLFFTPETDNAIIYISRENYSDTTVLLKIETTMIEIWPGMPAFYFMLLMIVIGAIGGSLGAYRYVQVKKIPKFVKKNKSLRKTIDSKGKISDSALYPPKEVAISKLLGNRWSKIGMSLEDVLGVGRKKSKKTIGKGDNVEIKKEGGES
ncbi:MAG: LamG-like jellyroll fold domain-containing protein [Promethearchaeota archaeon]